MATPCCASRPHAPATSQVGAFGPALETFERNTKLPQVAIGTAVVEEHIEAAPDREAFEKDLKKGVSVRAAIKGHEEDPSVWRAAVVTYKFDDGDIRLRWDDDDQEGKTPEGGQGTSTGCASRLGPAGLVIPVETGRCVSFGASSGQFHQAR